MESMQHTMSLPALLQIRHAEQLSMCDTACPTFNSYVHSVLCTAVGAHQQKGA